MDVWPTNSNPADIAPWLLSPNTLISCELWWGQVDRWFISFNILSKCLVRAFQAGGKLWRKWRTETATGGVLSKKVILNKFIENPFARISFLIKLQEKACNFIKKRGSDTSAFLWILRNFLELVFYRTPLDDCFWKEKSVFLASSEMLLGIVELMDNSQYRSLQ